MVAKRNSTASKAPQAKKAKTAAPEAPLLAFLAAATEMPKSSRDMLQVALPLCLEVVESDRHKFQIEVLERVAALLADSEKTKREAISTVEASLAEMEVENASALANVESKKTVASGKQGECDEKGKLVDTAREAEKAAQAALTTAQQQAEAFQAKKSAMLLEQEGFAKLLNDGLQSLKEGTFAGNSHKRNKLIGELAKKLMELGAQQSLSDAMTAALKMKPNVRDGSTFAKATMQFVEEYFTKHTAKLAQDISGLDGEEATIKEAGVVAEAALTARKGELQQIEKEWDEMQDVWVKLEEDVATASKHATSVGVELPEAKQAAEEAKVELEEFLELQALFSKLREQSTAVPEAPDEPAAAEEEPEPEAAEDAPEEMQA